MNEKYRILETQLELYLQEVYNELDEISKMTCDSEEVLICKIIKLQEFLIKNNKGYLIEKIEEKAKELNQYKCHQCKYLSDEKCIIGRKCVHPTKVFHTSTAHWKYPSCKACKLFEERMEE